MMAISVSKTWKVPAALMACLLAAAAVVCLVHTDAFDETHTPFQGHHHTSSSPSAHITLDLHCLLAILPTTVVLVWLCLGAFSLTVLWSHPLVPVFPPFIPPRLLAYA